MICSNCGAQNSPGSKFCETCGSKLAEAQVQQQPVEQQPVQYVQPARQPVQYASPVAIKPKKSKIGLIIGIVVGSVVLVTGLIIGAILLFIGNNSKIDIDEDSFTEVEVDAEDEEIADAILNGDIVAGGEHSINDIINDFMLSQEEVKPITANIGLYSQDEEIEDIMTMETLYDNKGLLFDLDGNGVEELILLFTAFDDEVGVDTLYASVYTINQNQEVCNLIDKAKLYAQAGGPNGYVSVVESEGKTSLAICSESGETGAEDGQNNRYGRFDRYEIVNDKLNLSAELRYREEYEDGEFKPSATINDIEIDYDEAMDYMDKYETVAKMQEYAEDDSSPIGDLFEGLKSNIDDALSSSDESYSEELTTVVSYNDDHTIKRLTLTETEMYDCYIEVPVFRESTEGYTKINQYFDEILRTKFTGVNEVYYLSCVDMALTMNPMEVVYSDTTSCEVKDKTDKYLSVVNTCFEYYGGTFGSGYITYNFDTQTGEKINLAQALGVSDEEALECVYEAMRAYEENEGYEVFFWDSVESIPLSDINFKIQNGKAIAMFSKYEVATGAAGSFQIELSLPIAY